MNIKNVFFIMVLSSTVLVKSEEKRALLTSDMQKMLDAQTERSLTCQRKLRVLTRPLTEEFYLKNYDTIEKFKENLTQAQLTDDEIKIIDALVTEFCDMHLEKITAYALEVYGIVPNTVEAESFVYSFKKAFPIGYKEEFINSLEIQRAVVLEVKKRKLN